MRYVMSLALAHATCARRIREALAGDDPFLELSAKDREQLTASRVVHDREAKR
jgi:hypothetical protein